MLRHLSSVFVKGGEPYLCKRVLNVTGHRKFGRFPPNGHTPRTVTTFSTSSSAPIQYVLDNDVLTDEQADFYSENGFLIIRKLVPQEKLDKYWQCFERVCREKDLPQDMQLMKDIALTKAKYTGEIPVSRIQYLHNFPDLMEYSRLPEILRYVKCFTGPNILAIHTMLINKPTDSGTKSSRHPMHQDLYYFPYRPAERIVATWTAMEKIDVENGCLSVYPGSHNRELMDHDYPQWEGGVNSLYLGVVDYSSDQPRLRVEMEAGDTLLFHPLLIHGSGINRSTRTRKCISSHFASVDCNVLDEWEPIQGNYVKAVAKVVARKFKKKGLEWPTDYDPVKQQWLDRARLVHGNRRN
ncbi:phytanoyl-CoA dioxygenase, peroxisomal-like [Glandiceps talaboti]